MNLLTWIFI